MTNLTHISLIAVALLSMLSITSCSLEKEAPKRPNVILILADDLGYETIGANGGETYRTPAIDRMAATGMSFEHCYAQPLCTPSRIKLMTGISNVRNYVRFGLLDSTQTTFGHLFKQAGYNTCVVGKWQLGKDPEGPMKAGFDQHCLWQLSEGRMDASGRDTRYSKPVLEVDGELITYGDSDYGPDIVSNYGLDFIEKSNKEGKPFLLYYPMILTHCPFSPTPGSPEWMSGDSAVYSYKGEAQYFEDMVAETDAIVGKIYARLESLGIDDNTLVVFTGDNGTDEPVVSYMNGRKVAGGKWKSTDAGTRVPLVATWPDKIKANAVNTDLIDFSDLFPTLCEAAGIQWPGELDIDGISFLPQLNGEKGNPREWVYNWFSRSGKESEARVFARNHRYKLYDTGEFYEIPKDYEEQDTLRFEELNADARSVHNMLEEVIKKYEKRRLDKIPTANSK